MLSPFVLYAVFGRSQLGPLERFEAYMAEAAHLSVGFTAKSAGRGEPAQGKYQLERGVRQLWSLKWEGQEWRWLQSPEGGFWTDVSVKKYQEFPPIPKLIPPGKWAPAHTIFTYPGFLTLGTLRGESDNWRVEKEEAPSILVATNQTEIGPEELTATVDAAGRLTSFRRKTTIGDVTLEFTGYDREPFPAKVTEIALPLGFVPTAITAAADFLATGDKVEFGKVADGSSGNPSDIPKGSKGTLIVFTAPECSVTARMTPFMGRLSQEMKKDGLEAVELSLGSGQPNMQGRTWPVRWDKDGRLEKAWGLGATPHFWVVSPQGVILSAWSGFREGEEKEILAALRAGLSQEEAPRPPGTGGASPRPSSS